MEIVYIFFIIIVALLIYFYNKDVPDEIMMKRYDIINYLIQKRGYTKYLEIGTYNKENFNKIHCETKECIDPMKNDDVIYTYNMGSDEAFAQIKQEGKKYDIIFIDGLHLEEQVDRDIQNSLDSLAPGGIIILHDCNPLTPIDASDPRISNQVWNGTVYKSIVKLRCTNSTVSMYVVDTDYGCGIIDPFASLIIPTSRIDVSLIPDSLIDENDKIVNGPIFVNGKNITWNYFEKNKKALLNLISPQEFKNIY